MKRKNSPPGFPPARGLILVPVDFSETSLRALDAAVALAYGARSRLLLLHVVESYPMDRLLGDTLTAHATMPLLKEAEARLGTLAADLKKQSGVSVEAASRFGRPFDEITRPRSWARI
jgi:nucleotide-binding universal stress UspA family protein